MTPLEELLQRTFTAHENDGLDAIKIIEGVRQGLARQRRREKAFVWTLAITFFAAAVTVPLTLAHRNPSTGRIAVAPTSGPAVPTGMQPVSFHGVEVFIPKQWEVNDTDCGTPVADTAIIEDGAPTTTCLIPQKPGLTVVRLVAADTQEGRLRASVATEQTQIDGYPAFRGIGTPRGESIRLAVLVLPDPGVVVSAESPDLTNGTRILNSAQVVPVDSAGCSALVSPLEPNHQSQREGSHTVLVPDTPWGASVCRYSGNWLATSVALTQTQMNTLRGILDALPEGTSVPAGGEEAPDACAQDSQRGFIARFNFAAGEPLLVYVHIGGCDGLSASNGSRTTKISEQLVDFLTTIAGYDSGYPDPRSLDASTPQSSRPSQFHPSSASSP